MAENEVKYVLTLKDGMSTNIDLANAKAMKLESTMGNLGNRVSHVAEAFGISFAMFKGFEFVKQGKDEFEEIEKANSQLQAGLISTRGVAGITLSDLQAGAKEAADAFSFTRAQVLDMQSVLLTFPSVTKDTFGDASQAIFDISTRMGQDLKSSAVEVGKALQDPIRGMTALRRIGVNFTDAQEKAVKVMVQTGHAAKAQAVVLHELQTEFAGSAKAAADSDPLFRYQKNMEDIRDTVGHLATDFLRHLTPALEFVSHAFKSATEWAEKHREIMKAVADVLLPVVAAIGAIVVATRTWVAVQWLINAAILANPIVRLIVGLAAVVGGIIAAYKHFAAFRAVLWATWGVVKEFGRLIKEVFMGIGEMMHGITHFNLSEIKEGWGHAADAIGDAAKRIAKAAHDGYNEGMADFNKDQAGEKSLIPAPKPVKGGLAVATTAAVKEPKTKATGSKSVTINVTIQKMTGIEKMETTNFHESTKRMKDALVEMLTGAVNDFQIVSGG